MYDALTISRYIIRKHGELGHTISNLKLQKVLYFIQAEFLVSVNRPCFNDKIEAWDFGPVVPAVYRNYKVYGAAQIPIPETSREYFVINHADKVMIDDIINECLKYSAAQLTEITIHQTPWMDAYHSAGVHNEITQDSIREFFSEDEDKKG